MRVTQSEVVVLLPQVGAVLNANVGNWRVRHKGASVTRTVRTVSGKIFKLKVSI